ncbi:hypothetical protein I4U23_017339 [Adineta vaga]|nr:hypothetical protein I4U23_017339 [Adineta vaga]
MKKFINSNDYNNQRSVLISCTLVMFGADLTIRNQQNQIPFDLCSDNKHEIIFHPCLHIVTCQSCANRMKKCLLCKQKIQIKTKSIVSFNELCIETISSTNDNNTNDSLTLTSLQQQLEEIREQVHCPICMDRLKDMIFLCGHGVCQNCGNRLQEYPICRKQIEKSIILYT